MGDSEQDMSFSVLRCNTCYKCFNDDFVYRRHVRKHSIKLFPNICPSKRKPEHVSVVKNKTIKTEQTSDFPDSGTEHKKYTDIKIEADEHGELISEIQVINPEEIAIDTSTSVSLPAEGQKCLKETSGIISAADPGVIQISVSLSPEKAASSQSDHTASLDNTDPQCKELIQPDSPVGSESNTNEISQVDCSNLPLITTSKSRFLSDENFDFHRLTLEHLPDAWVEFGADDCGDSSDIPHFICRCFKTFLDKQELLLHCTEKHSKILPLKIHYFPDEDQN